MTCRVELVYDSDCPNVGQARAALLQAFSRARISASWIEWDRKAPESPTYVHGYGSPTILVDGKDVADAEPGEGADRCRLYLDEKKRFRGVPSIRQIAVALTKSDETEAATGSGAGEQFGWRGLLAVVPGVGTALLPVLTCPACWPAYAGLLGTVGLGFLLDTAYLLPIAVILLGLALASLAYRARSRRGYKPLGVGVVGMSIALASKFAFSKMHLSSRVYVLILLLDRYPPLLYEPVTFPPQVPIGGKGKPVRIRRGPATVKGKPLAMMSLSVGADGKTAERRRDTRL